MTTVADATQTITLDVTGMSCGSCERHVRQELDQVPGYRSAEVDLGTGRVRVSFERGTATPEQLVEAVVRAGYSWSRPSSGPGMGPRSRHCPKRRRPADRRLVGAAGRS